MSALLPRNVLKVLLDEGSADGRDGGGIGILSEECDGDDSIVGTGFSRTEGRPLSLLGRGSNLCFDIADESLLKPRIARRCITTTPDPLGDRSVDM